MAWQRLPIEATICSKPLEESWIADRRAELRADRKQCGECGSVALFEYVLHHILTQVLEQYSRSHHGQGATRGYPPLKLGLESTLIGVS